MKQELKIVLVEDSEADADLLTRCLKKENLAFRLFRVWLKEDFIRALDEFHPDLIISDNSLPVFSGMEAFRIMQNGNKKIPFILMSGTVPEELLKEYMKEGIDEYLMKDNLLELNDSIERVMNRKKTAPNDRKT